MNDRLASTVLVNALLRRVNDAGGMAMVLAKGDLQGGAILIVACEKGREFKIMERGIGPSGQIELIAAAAVAGDDAAQVTAYWQRRRARDSDLWVIELDIAQAERFAAETIATG